MTGFTCARVAGLLAGLAICGSASASMLEFRPSSAALGVGSEVGVDVYFVPDAVTLLNEFDITVDWDPAILTLTDVSFGSLLGMPPDADQELILDIGSADVFESAGDLSAQSGSDAFRLFTLTFEGAQLGTSGLTFDSAVLHDDQGNPIDVSPGSGSVTVADLSPPDVDVPLPGALWVWLLFSGIGGLRLARHGVSAREALS
jgi:hypothetical protein